MDGFSGATPLSLAAEGGTQALTQAGIHQNLIRLSVGIECSEDLVLDVLQALNAAQRAAEYPALTAVAE